MRTSRRSLIKLRMNAPQIKEVLLRGTASLQLAAAGENKRPTFEINAYNGGAIQPDRPYLEAPLVIDLSGVSSPDRISAVLDHDDRKIVGQTSRVRVSNKSIEMAGVITGPYETERHPAWEVVSQAKGGYVWPVSLGADIRNLEYVAAGSSVTVNNATHPGPLYVARRTQLRHISFLSDGADQTASARIAAAAAKESQMDFNAWLKAKNIDPEKLDDPTREALRASFDAEQKLTAGGGNGGKKGRRADDDEGDDDDSRESRKPKQQRKRTASANGDPLAAAKAKRERLEAGYRMIKEAGEEFPDAIEALAELHASFQEDEDYALHDLETGILRVTSMSQRVDNRLRGRNDTAAIDSRVVEAALCMGGGLSEKTLTDNYSEDVLNRAQDRFRVGLSLNDFLCMAARARGITALSFRQDSEMILRAAFYRDDPFATRQLRASSFSSYDASTILSNVMNKYLLDFFNAVDMAPMNRITAKQPVKDFKQITSVTLTGDMKYELVAPGGEIKHGTFGEKSYTNQADTYGKILGITRKDLINDDLGAFRRLGERMGRGGAYALLDLFWATFLANTDFFKTANNNYDDGADSALGIDGLTNAKTIFNKQTQPKADGTTGGRPLGIRPRILLVPPELEALGKQILNSQLIVMAGTAASVDVRGNANIHGGTLDLVMAPELSNSSYTGYSTTKWYLLANPAELPVIETCFLNGVERPTVENAMADFNTLGIQIRGYFDFGCALQEERGGVAMNGT